ncbi:MAG: nucleotidyltransferase family protein [Planctomycetota bacterium]
MSPRIEVPLGRIREFCRKWRVKEISLFGSVLRDDFRPDSDVDVLVDFQDDGAWGLLDLVHMEEELSAILGRKADLVDRRSVEASRNYIRRRRILDSLEPLYVAG